MPSPMTASSCQLDGCAGRRRETRLHLGGERRPQGLADGRRHPAWSAASTRPANGLPMSSCSDAPSARQNDGLTKVIIASRSTSTT